MNVSASSPLARALRAWAPRMSWGGMGAGVLVLIVLPCLVTLPWSLRRDDIERLGGNTALAAPSWAEPMGTDLLGRSLLWRVLLGGGTSLGIGACAAIIAVVIGVVWGGAAGYAGGRTDAWLMRAVDVLYGLPYILLVVLIDIALKPALTRLVRACYAGRFGFGIGGRGDAALGHWRGELANHGPCGARTGAEPACPAVH